MKTSPRFAGHLILFGRTEANHVDLAQNRKASRAITGRVEHVREGERLPEGQRGFTWREVEEEEGC